MSQPPTRIQRKRTKGYRMPAGTIYCGRPSRYGNPHKLGDVMPDGRTLRTAEDVVAEFQHTLAARVRDGWTSWIDELSKAKHLACWCRIGTPCHVDAFIQVLKELTEWNGYLNRGVHMRTYSVTIDKLEYEIEAFGIREALYKAVHIHLEDNPARPQMTAEAFEDGVLYCYPVSVSIVVHVEIGDPEEAEEEVNATPA